MTHAEAGRLGGLKKKGGGKGIKVKQDGRKAKRLTKAGKLNILNKMSGVPKSGKVKSVSNKPYTGKTERFFTTVNGRGVKG